MGSKSSHGMRTFPKELPSHKAIPHDADSAKALRWERDHEKRRLKAYLRGDTRFAHGSVVTPLGRRPIMFDVVEKPSEESFQQQ